MTFTTPNIVVAHPIPDETRIYYSKDSAVSGMVISIIFFGAGLLLLISGLDRIAGALICFIIAGIQFYAKITVFNDKTPQIILNKHGVQTANRLFYKWEEIKQIDIDTMWMSRGPRKFYLVYKTPDDERVSVDVSDMNIDEKGLKVLLCFYRSYEPL